MVNELIVSQEETASSSRPRGSLKSTSSSIVSSTGREMVTFSMLVFSLSFFCVVGCLFGGDL